MATKVNNLCSNVGDPFYAHFKYKWSDEDNCMIPYVDSKFNLYEKIQLAKSTCDLDVIIKRAKAGDVSVLHVKNEFYGDVSEMPDNLNDMKALSDKVNDSFNDLPQDIKNLFGNDISVFSKAVQSGSFNDTINNYIISLGKKKENNEVKEETK